MSLFKYSGLSRSTRKNLLYFERLVISGGLAIQKVFLKFNGAFDVYTASLVSTSSVLQNIKELDFKSKKRMHALGI